LAASSEPQIGKAGAHPSRREHVADADVLTAIDDVFATLAQR
jgi:hypothetical protein